MFSRLTVSLTLLGLGFASAQQAPRTIPYAVMVSRDEKLIREFKRLTFDDEYRALAKSKDLELVTTKEERLVLIDRRLVRGDTSKAIDLICERVKGAAGKCFDAETATKEERTLIRKLLSKSTLPGQVATAFASSPDLKLGAQPWLKITLQKGDHQVTMSFGVGEANGSAPSEELITASVNDQLIKNSAKTIKLDDESADNADSFTLTFTAAPTLEVRSQLSQRAMKEFGVLLDQEQERRRKLLAAILGKDAAWDGKSPIDFDKLSPELRRNLEKGILGTCENYGFSGPDAAKLWLKGAQIKQASFDVMIWAARQSPHGEGVFLEGFTLGNIRN